MEIINAVIAQDVCLSVCLYAKRLFSRMKRSLLLNEVRNSHFLLLNTEREKGRRKCTELNQTESSLLPSTCGGGWDSTKCLTTQAGEVFFF